MTLRRLKDILFVLALLGAVAAALRLVGGLGATTDLSDEIPWGLWKVLNMIAGVALATGGFTMAFAVHILGIRSLKPLLRPALLLAFIGYGSSCAALLFDIGLPHRFWHPMVFWNEHSFLFEVFWCVMLYFTVTVLEVSPIAAEGSPRFQRIYGFLKKISLPVMILGITFSTLHHSSLGSLFLVSPTRLHELWYTPLLPLLFILSAIGAGLMAVVLLTLVTARLYRRTAPAGALRKVAVASVVVLSLYLAVRLVDLAARGSLGAVFSGEWEGRLFLLEIALAVLLPVVLIALPRVRRSRGGLAAAASFAVAGLVLNRLDVGIFGYFRSSGGTYLPTLAELALTLGIPAAGGLFYFAFIERFRVFDFGVQRIGPEAVDPVLAFQPQTAVWHGALLNNLERLSLMAVFVVPVAIAAFSVPAGAESASVKPVGPPFGADGTRSVLRIDGDRNGAAVLFPHDEHKKRLGGEKSCAECHHLDRPQDTGTSCHLCHTDMDSARSIFDHERHVGRLSGNRSCAQCHAPDRPRSRESAKACYECHAEDMGMERDDRKRLDLAPSYRDAMHRSCVECHEKERAPSDCRTCHD